MDPGFYIWYNIHDLLLFTPFETIPQSKHDSPKHDHEA